MNYLKEHKIRANHLICYVYVGSLLLWLLKPAIPLILTRSHIACDARHLKLALNHIH